MHQMGGKRGEKKNPKTLVNDRKTRREKHIHHILQFDSPLLLFRSADHLSASNIYALTVSPVEMFTRHFSMSWRQPDALQECNILFLFASSCN